MYQDKGIRIASRAHNNNLTVLYVGELTLWFSYETVVAFAVPGIGRVVCENVWSATTGKHLNSIDFGNKSARVPRAEFERRLELVQDKLNTALAAVRDEIVGELS